MGMLKKEKKLHLNELGYVKGEWEQGDRDDVDHESPGGFDSVFIHKLISVL